MKTLEQFIKDKKIELQNATRKSLAVVVNSTSNAALVALPKQEKKNISDELSKIVTKDEFISELSNNIGMPRKNETEEEFVLRAKGALRTMLRKKLG
jgi:hypothetical protein